MAQELVSFAQTGNVISEDPYKVMLAVYDGNCVVKELQTSL